MPWPARHDEYATPSSEPSCRFGWYWLELDAQEHAAIADGRSVALVVLEPVPRACGRGDGGNLRRCGFLAASAEVA